MDSLFIMNLFLCIIFSRRALLELDCELDCEEGLLLLVFPLPFAIMIFLAGGWLDRPLPCLCDFQIIQPKCVRTFNKLSETVLVASEPLEPLLQVVRATFK